MKWLKEGLKGGNNNKYDERSPLNGKKPNKLNAPKNSNYIELIEETGSGGNQTPMTVTTQTNDDGKEEEEDQDAEARRLYGDSDDEEDDDDDNETKKQEIITPMDPNPQTTLYTPNDNNDNMKINITPKPLELINSAEAESDDEMVINEEEMQ